MLAVTTSIENIYVKIAWSYPADNNDPITQYEIKIRQSDGVTYSV